MYRTIDSDTWSDAWFLKQEPDAKVYFLWLVTNRHAHMTGFYRLPYDVVVELETGLTQERLLELQLRFEADGKVMFGEDRQVWVVNQQKYQVKKMTWQNARHIQVHIEEMPDGELKEAYLRKYPLGKVGKEKAKGNGGAGPLGEYGEEMVAAAKKRMPEGVRNPQAYLKVVLENMQTENAAGLVQIPEYLT